MTTPIAISITANIHSANLEAAIISERVGAYWKAMDRSAIAQRTPSLGKLFAIRSAYKPDYANREDLVYRHQYTSLYGPPRVDAED